MRGAYKYAISTVVAAAVSTSTVSYFFSRERDSVRTSEVHATLGGKIRQLVVFGTDDRI